MKNYKKYNGTTLIETLLYVALTSLILTILVTFYTALVSARFEHEAITEVEKQSEFIIYELTEDLRATETIVSPTAGNTNAGLQINLIGDPEQVSYALASNVIERNQSVENNAMNGTKVLISNLEFSNLDDQLIEYSFTASFSNPDGRYDSSYTQDYSGVIRLRQQ